MHLLQNFMDVKLLFINFRRFFFLSGFSFTDTDNSQDSRGREGTILFHSTTSTRSRTFRHLFATLHMRWLSHTFSLHCLYLPDYYTMRFTTLSNYYLIGWWCDVDFCLFACWFYFTFCYSYMTWEKLVDSNSCRISSLYYNQTDK